jgi:hypothetical protein
MEKDKVADDEEIVKLNYENENDEEYSQIENYGKLIETWIADNCRCPICKEKTLRRYTKNNFPIIDLVCINKNHYDGVRFFQVKTSVINNNKASIHKGKYYFNLDLDDNNKNTILAGSRNWGEPIHNIKPSEAFDDLEKLLIGYICILYNINVKNYIHESLQINKSLSFIVLPNTLLTTEDITDDYYYKYTNLEDKEIHFNIKTNNIIDLNDKLINKTSGIKNILFSDEDIVDDEDITKPLIDTTIININYDVDKKKWITIENPFQSI